MRLQALRIACVAVLIGLAACHEKGPAEKAGESIDHAGQKVQDTLDPPKGPVEAAGRMVDRALGN
jgi:hypothetical protein